MSLDLEVLHPSERLAAVMKRIYGGGMTTASGGNLSIMDDGGNLWITPSGTDKGSLTREDICRVAPDGAVTGAHKPSVELPIHAGVYKRRPELRAVLHAHPPGLVAFSMARRLPDVNLWDDARRICGAVVMAKYAVPGSEELGGHIADGFEKGFDVVLMENHGVCVGAETMSEAYMKFAALEACAAVEINALRLGTPQPLSASDAGLAETPDQMEEFERGAYTEEEREVRRSMAEFIRRAYRQRLFGSFHGTCSARLSGGAFLITPRGADRGHMDADGLVLIKDGMRERGKQPSRRAKLHQAVYGRDGGINAIMGASPPYVMAFAVTDEPPDTRTIPESYISLRQIQRTPFRTAVTKPETAAGLVSADTPVLICGNSHILAAGSSLLEAFSRVEVAEATARSILTARALGEPSRITDREIAEINAAFGL